MPELHPEASKILARLRAEKIEALYHFTPVKNLCHILEAGGLISKQDLENNGGWPPPRPGGNELSHNLDRQKGNWDRISLSLTPHTPMAYWRKRETHLCFFVVQLDVAAWKDILFTDTNAAGGAQKREGGILGLDNMDFSMITSDLALSKNPKWKRGVQAEVLVKGQIPLSFITEVAFVSEASRQHAQELCGIRTHTKFAVKPTLFFDSRQASSQPSRRPDFPHVIELTLTNHALNDSNCNSEFNHQQQFIRGQDQFVACRVKLHASSGSKGSFRWPFLKFKEKEINFQSTGDWYSWAYQPLNSIPIGTRTIEYWLNAECWASTSFEVSEDTISLRGTLP